MKPYTDKTDKVDERKCLYSEIKGNNKPRKKAARRKAKKDVDEQLDMNSCEDCLAKDKEIEKLKERISKLIKDEDNEYRARQQAKWERDEIIGCDGKDTMG